MLKLLEFPAEKGLEVLELCLCFILATVRPVFLNLFDVGSGLADGDDVHGYNFVQWIRFGQNLSCYKPIRHTDFTGFDHAFKFFCPTRTC